MRRAGPSTKPTARFSEQHLEHVQSILIADAVTTPLVRFLDISGKLNRYWTLDKVKRESFPPIAGTEIVLNNSLPLNAKKILAILKGLSEYSNFQ